MSRQNNRSGAAAAAAAAAAATAPLDAKSRQNEFFVHREGIDRDVITADICTYLGNDALVKPGVWVDEKTGIEHHGYYVTAYRNLTTAMIDDLKADSARWESERRKHQNSTARYEGSHAQYHNRLQPGYSGGGAARQQNYDSSVYSQGGYSSTAAASKMQQYPAGYGSSVYPSGASGPYPSQGYPSGSTGYAAPGMDPRTYASGGMGAAQMSQMSQMTGGYPAGVSMSRPMVEPNSAPYAVRADYDTAMTDAGPPQGGYGGARSSYPNQQPASGYPGYQPGVGQPQYPQGGQITQPVDLYYGRGPGPAYPAGSSAPSAYAEGTSAPVPGMPFNPGPDQYEANPVSRASAASPAAQAQVSSSGPSERRERTSEYRDHRGEYRETRDRDRRDRGDREERQSEKRRHQR